ncbi:uncharacterized protein WM294_013031 isoform 1-T1 [Sarcoramphus papa]
MYNGKYTCLKLFFFQVHCIFLESLALLKMEPCFLHQRCCMLCTVQAAFGIGRALKVPQVMMAAVSDSGLWVEQVLKRSLAPAGISWFGDAASVENGFGPLAL